MKIALLLSEFPVLSETFVLDQITGLIDRGHDVHIYADRPRPGTIMHPDVERYRLLERTHYWGVSASLPWRALQGLGLLAGQGWRNPRAMLGSLRVGRYGLPAAFLVLLHAAARLLRRHSFDVVHGHFGPCGLLAAALRDLGLLDGAVLTSFYGYDLTRHIRRFGPRIYQPLFERGDILLPLCGAFEQHLLRLGCPPGKIVVHHIGVDCRRFAWTPRSTPADGRVRLVTVARLAEKKGLDVAIEAVARLLPRHPGMEYEIVGDGPLRDDLARLITRLHVDQFVHLRGSMPRPEVVRVLERAHIFLAPSVTARDGDQEGTPTVIMEAAAMGLPVVSTRHSGIPEIVEDGVTGYLVAERDVDALGERIEHLLAHPADWTEMGRSGRRIVEERFNINALNDELVRIYLKAAADGGRTA